MTNVSYCSACHAPLARRRRRYIIDADDGDARYDGGRGRSAAALDTTATTTTTRTNMNAARVSSLSLSLFPLLSFSSFSRSPSLFLFLSPSFSKRGEIYAIIFPVKITLARGRCTTTAD